MNAIPTTHQKIQWSSSPGGTRLKTASPHGNARNANKIIAQRFFKDVLTQRCEHTADEVISQDAIISLPVGQFAGPAGAVRLSARLQAAYPGYRITVEDLIADGDHVAARWTLRGTQRGEFMGVPPTGKPTTTQNLSLFRLIDGKIVEGWTAEC